MNVVPLISVADVSLSRGGTSLFNGLSFDVLPGDRLAVMGGSGSGKSSLLQALLGRAVWAASSGRHGGRRPVVTAGSIQIGGIPHERQGEWVGWLAANAGILFQSGALFDGKTVGENLAFPFRHAPVRTSDTPRRPDYNRLAVLLRQVGLLATGASPKPRDELLGRQSTELSGGQQKRLALARALALNPRLLLLDEPTSGLDTATSKAIAETIRQLSERDGVAVLCITHDPSFVERLNCNKQIAIGPDLSDQAVFVHPSVGVAAESVRHRGLLDVLGMSLTQTFHRFCRLLLDGAMLCTPVALIAGAGLVIQAVAGPRLIQTFLAQGVVVGVFLGMGTIIPALLVIGLSASGMAGELTQRKHGGQLEYLRLLKISPMAYLAVPIVVAMMVAMPLLIWATEFLMLAGGYAALKGFEARASVTAAYFWNQVWMLVTPDMWQRSAIKGITHGALIGLSACVCGFSGGTGEQGLRKAISMCVLIASLAIIIGDVLWSSYWAGQW